MHWPAEYALCNLRYGKNYNSKGGMQSAIFGPAFWMTIHITSFNYPVNPTAEDKHNYSNWLWSIGNILPCMYCRENFPKNMEAAHFHEKSLESRDSFSRFCYELHCVVNTMLNKTSPTYEEVRDRYELFRSRCLSPEQQQELQQSQKELGCIRPLHDGERGKCFIQIIPHDDDSSNNLIVHSKCLPKSN